MRSASACLLLVTALVSLAGCPLFNPPNADVEYTSAATRTVNRGEGVPTDAAGDPATDEFGEGEGPREVVEPDVIRRDGEVLYILNQYRGLSVVSLEDEALVAQLPLLGFPRDLYLVDDRAYVLVSTPNQISERNGGVVVSYMPQTSLFVVDTSDIAAPTILGRHDFQGDLVESRLVGSVLYAVTAEYTWYYEGGVVSKQQNSATRISSVNVADPDNITTQGPLDIAGYGNVIHATQRAIFVAAHDWATGDSTITYIDIDHADGAIKVRGSVAVPGQVADRFKMDAYEGVLRVVSNTWWPDRQVYVTTVDLTDPDALVVLGQRTIPGAENETLFATRFDGPRAYIVTYLIVDPLFVLDLSNPADPHLAGVLEVPGWSTHIEPRGDRLIALGVDDTDGGRRVSVSIFDVSDLSAPALADRVSFGENWSWSSAYSDVKAFTVLDDTLIVPFSGWNEARGGYERLQFISYTRDSLAVRGFADLRGQILRSFAYGEKHYAVTTEQLAILDARDLDTPAIENSVTLAENVVDVQELPGGLLAEIVERYDTQDGVVHIGTQAGARQGSVALPLSGFVDSFVHAGRLVLVGTRWDHASGKSSYQVFVVDAGRPAAPRVTLALEVEVQPYWGGWWWYADTAVGGAEGGKRAVADIGPYWWSPSQSAFLTGDVLALRCFGERFDTTLGTTRPQEGLALVDLARGALRGTVGLGFENIQSLDAAGDKLYLGTRRDASRDAVGRPLAAYFLAEIDPTGPRIARAVNVPGSFVAYDPVTDLLLTQDVQYDRLGYNVRNSLNSLRWDGTNAATRIDVERLPEGVWSTPKARGSRIYYEHYSNGYGIGTVNVARDGGLSSGAALPLGDTWAYLVDADEEHLYAVLGGFLVGRYDFSASPPTLDASFATISPPSRIRFGATQDYMILGYAGVERF